MAGDRDTGMVAVVAGRGTAAEVAEARAPDMAPAVLGRGAGMQAPLGTLWPWGRHGIAWSGRHRNG